MLKKQYKDILKMAWPIILANASVPILGLVDTAVIGQTGTAIHLGAIALAALIFNFVYWGFGFLRMGTTGFVAQAKGAQQQDELHALVFRTLLLGCLIGLALIILQWPIERIATSWISASDAVLDEVRAYFYVRIWGAPATLMIFALLGIFIGMGWSKQLLITQLVLNGLNIIFNILFVLGLHLGVKGIALGTLVAEWLAWAVALAILLPRMGLRHPLQRFAELLTNILDAARLKALFSVNANIMIRTLALIAGFAWFANEGAKFGDGTLAANHILLQFISLSAFFLDGYANVAEALVGQAYGARDTRQFSQVIKDSTVLAAITAFMLALLFYYFGHDFIVWLTQDRQVQAIARVFNPWAAVYIFSSFAAFQLDGIFIGVTQTRQMRNATILALLSFVALSVLLTPRWDNHGLWIAFIGYVVVRAIALGAYYPALRRSAKAQVED